MAKRSFNKKARALQPAVMKLHFAVAADSVSKYIDISECVSRLNRRFYRQGLNWAVANVKMTVLPNAGAAPSQAYVNTIPHTWPVASAWVKAFHAWKDQQDEAIAVSTSETAVARFRDFKVYADIDHATQLFGSNLDPLTLGPGNIVGPFAPGIVTGPSVLPSEEWLASEIVIPNVLADASGSLTLPREFGLHMIGDGNPSGTGTKGIVDGYQYSRAYPQSPDPVSPAIESADNWMRTMFDVGSDTSEITANATLRNDELPYDQVEYPGTANNLAQLECQGYVSNASTVGIRTFNTGPFTAPCGLIRLDFLYQDGGTDAGADNIVTVELVPGNHRGYLCETMEEF